MRLSINAMTLVTTSALQILTHANALLPPQGETPAPTVAGFTLPAALPTQLVSSAASALNALPTSVAISMPTGTLSWPGNPDPSDLVPGLSLPPEVVLDNVEACSEILGVVIALLSPLYADPDGGVGGGDGDGGDDADGDGNGRKRKIARQAPGGEGFDINGGLVTTLIQSAAGLLSLVPPPTPNS